MNDKKPVRICPLHAPRLKEAPPDIPKLHDGFVVTHYNHGLRRWFLCGNLFRTRASAESFTYADPGACEIYFLSEKIQRGASTGDDDDPHLPIPPAEAVAADRERILGELLRVTSPHDHDLLRRIVMPG